MENKHKKFAPYDRVLVKAFNGKWKCSFYSHWDEGFEKHITTANVSYYDNEILPYEGNKDLVGTTEEPVQEIELEEGEKIICSDHIDRLHSGKGSLEDFDGVVNNRFYAKTDFTGYSYAIRFSDFNPNDMEETKKNILCVKNGKIIRYKE